MTIAFDGKTLAVDRAAWTGSDVWTEVQKLFYGVLTEDVIKKLRLSEYGCSGEFVYAAAGSAAEVPLILEWFDKGGDRPQLIEKDTTRGILLSKDTGKCFAVTGILTLVPYESSIVADGAGHEMVLGAMLAGADACKAVEIVASRSGFAAGGVSSYTLTQNK